MKSDILILSDSLVEPPSETYAIRTVTMLCHDKLAMDTILHTTQDMKDLYYHWMKTFGMMDYIFDIIIEREWQEGIRIDIVGFYPDTIVTKAIRLENQLSLLGRIQCFREAELSSRESLISNRICGDT